MKRFLIFALSVLLILGALGSCSQNKADTTADISLQTKETDDQADEPLDAVACSVASIVAPSDKTDSEALAILAAVNDYTTQKSLTYAEISATKDTSASCLSAIKRAVAGGAHIIVLPSCRSGEAVGKASVNFPDVRFVAAYNTHADTPDVGFAIKKNTALVGISGEAGGYLAGYAAVYEQKYNLSVLAGEASESSLSYALGFIQGAEAAAEKLSLPDSSVSVTLCYSGSGESDNGKSAELFSGSDILPGSDLIFACGKALTEAAYDAAAASGKLVIGTDGDYSYCSSAMLTFIKTDIVPAFADILSKTDSNSDWVDYCGKQNNYSVLPDKSAAIGLADSFDRFTAFNETEYASALAQAQNLSVCSVTLSSPSGYPEVSDITSVLSLPKINLMITAPQTAAIDGGTVDNAEE
ncbi:MAG: BMP family ABC transporter substrate-binding protein [Firmicutes bacterium]|nr:BMP family ABC transporter substrate-binding protein [Bacillota bacterium]